jgi:hypothetical protein
MLGTVDRRVQIAPFDRKALAGKLAGVLDGVAKCD